MEIKTFEQRDEFKRKPIAENIIKLLASDIDISPMVIDGSWGTGKTEFCQKLIELMRQEEPGYQPVYIDAFQSDYSGEPLLALLAQIIKDCTPEDEDNGEPSEKRKTLTKKFAKAAGFVVKTVAKAATGHLLKQSAESLAEGFQQVMENTNDAEIAAEKVSDTMVELSDKAIDSTIEILLKEQMDAEKNLGALRCCLSEFAADKPIVLFIDELDRCRPDYAVEMLETIKHVFDVPNVKVVLITNTQQLRAAINHRYGLSVDSHRYLNKFLKYSFNLPEKALDGYEDYQILASVKYFSVLVEKSTILKETKLVNQGDSIFSFASSLVERNGISLREVETFVRHLEIYQRVSKGLDNDIIFGYQLLRITAVFMFCFAPAVVETIHRNKTNAKQIAHLLGISHLPDFTAKEYRRSFADIVAVMLAQESTFNSQEFHSSDEEVMVHWKEWKQICFQEKYSFGREPDNIFSPIKETFNYLGLV